MMRLNEWKRTYRLAEDARDRADKACLQLYRAMHDAYETGDVQQLAHVQSVIDDIRSMLNEESNRISELAAKLQ